MLRKVRLTFAILFYTVITLLFLDFTGSIHTWLGWMAKIQFLPAILALNVGVILFLIALTLLFGRVYCSIICPLGIMQDIVSWLSGQRKKKKYRFTYSPAKSVLRYTILIIFIIAIIGSIGFLIALLDPYSAYGRIASNLFAPLYGWGNNLLAYFAERTDSYAFYQTTVWMKSLPTFIIAATSFVIIAILAWHNGRTYCNTICPVGTVLGFLSRFSLFRIDVDPNKCTSCNLCARQCKAACINIKGQAIDHSRCVACMDCVNTCKHGALRYTLHHKKRTDTNQRPPEVTTEQPVNETRRAFLSSSILLISTTALNAQEKKVDGGLAVIEKKIVPNRSTAIIPPGTLNAHDFARHCTGCQLCVSVCPNEVLRPSTKLIKLMQPEMSYERGYCRPECTKCSEVCPAGAIRPITAADKSATQIGHAVWVKANCIPLTDGVECGNCARHCPTGAIQMIPADKQDPSSLKIPIVNTERCIGCGACENLCPARPFSAIYVEGHDVHRII